MLAKQLKRSVRTKRKISWNIIRNFRWEFIRNLLTTKGTIRAGESTAGAGQDF